MDRVMLFSGTYEDIIQTLGSWRILDLSTLLKKVNYNYSHQAFAKRVKKLEDSGYLESVYFQSYRKYLYLTDKGLHEAGLHGAWSVNKDIIYHDIITVNIFQYFLGLPQIQNGNIYLDRAGADRRPDCYVNVHQNKRKVKQLAIEVELTQKSYRRIEDKFRDYLNKDYSHDLVIYVFQKTNSFRAYKEEIERLDKHTDPLKGKRHKDKIALILSPEIKYKTFDLLKATAFFEGKITTLKNILTDMEFES